MSYEVWGDDDDRFEAAIKAGWIDPTDISNGMRDVMNERARQWDEEHFDPAHDDQYVRGELIKAAICYSVPAVTTAELLASGMPPALEAGIKPSSPSMWPWAREWWKPKDRRHDLVRAAALLVAEIERLDRAAAKAAQP